MRFLACLRDCRSESECEAECFYLLRLRLLVSLRTSPAFAKEEKAYHKIMNEAGRKLLINLDKALDCIVAHS